MSEPTFNQRMVTTIEAALEESPLASEVTIDGTRVAFADAVARLKEFRRRVAFENGTRRTITHVDLSARAGSL